MLRGWIITVINRFTENAQPIPFFGIIGNNTDAAIDGELFRDIFLGMRQHVDVAVKFYRVAKRTATNAPPQKKIF